MESGRAQNTGLWASFVSASSENNFADIPLNTDLFNKMALPECYRQCARMGIDTVSTFELEQTYKCIITYKQSLQLIRELNQ